MKRSDSIVKIGAALLKAQKLMGGAAKGASNPFFKSKYADYGAVLEACKSELNDNGVVILQPLVTIEGRNYVETTLVHESGEWLSSEVEIICSKQNDPQAFGSAITYARRYGLQSLVALPAEDDDGESAMNRTPKAYPAKTQAYPAVVTAQAAATVAADNVTEIAEKKRSSFKANTSAPATQAAAPTTGVNQLGWSS